MSQTDYPPPTTPSTPDDLEALAQMTMLRNAIDDAIGRFASNHTLIDDRTEVARLAGMVAALKSYESTAAGLRVADLLTVLGDPTTKADHLLTWTNGDREIRLFTSPAMRSAHLHRHGQRVADIRRFHETTAAELAAWLQGSPLSPVCRCQRAMEVYQ